jgi:hypothetical protein
MSGGRRFLDVPRGPPRYDGPPSAPSSTGAPGSARRPSNAGSNTGPPSSVHGAQSQAGSGARDRSPGRQAPSQAGSGVRDRSPSRQPGSHGGMEGPRMVDPARDPSTLPRNTDMARNVDLSAAAYLLNNEVSLAFHPSTLHLHLDCVPSLTLGDTVHRGLRHLFSL